MNIRVFIPYKNPQITSVFLDGRPCPEGATNGYLVNEHSFYTNPTTSPTSSAFGTVTISTSPRSLQLGAKVNF